MNKELSRLPASASRSNVGKEAADTEGQAVTAAKAHEQLPDSWEVQTRPPGAAEVQDSSFVLEDEKLVEVADSLLACVTISDLQQAGNPTVFVSRSFETLTDFLAENLLGRDPFQVLDPAEPSTAQLRRAAEDRVPCTAECSCARADGSRFRAAVTVVPVLDRLGSTVKLLLLHQSLDSKEVKAAAAAAPDAIEALLARRQDQAQALLRAFMVVDATSRDASIASTSAGFEGLLGYGEADVLGLSALALAGPDSDKRAMKGLVTGCCSQQPGSSKLLCFSRAGTPTWCSMHHFPLFISDSPAQQADRARPRRPPLGHTSQVNLHTAAGHSHAAPVHGAQTGQPGEEAAVVLPQQPCARQQLVALVDVTASKQRRVGKYALGRIIGKGAFGTVRLGLNTATGERVAIKMVDASSFRSISQIDQIQDEISVLSGLKHPNIIRLLDMHFASNIFYFVMELASGGSLVDYVRKHEGRRLAEEDARRVFQQVSDAVDYCHRRRVIHRDLKPENILLDEAGNVKIADFGLAGITTPFSGNLTLACGTPEFTAPEIVRGKEYDGASVDVWSLGVILYELCQGRVPFQGKTQDALYKAIVRGVYDPLPDVISLECRDLVQKMLHVHPEERITMGDIRRHPWVRDDGLAAEVDDAPAGPRLDRLQSSLHLVIPDSLGSASPPETADDQPAGGPSRLADGGSRGAATSRLRVNVAPNPQLDKSSSGRSTGSVSTPSATATPKGNAFSISVRAGAADSPKASLTERSKPAKHASSLGLGPAPAGGDRSLHRPPSRKAAASSAAEHATARIPSFTGPSTPLATSRVGSFHDAGMPASPMARAKAAGGTLPPTAMSRAHSRRQSNEK